MAKIGICQSAESYPVRVMKVKADRWWSPCSSCAMWSSLMCGRIRISP